MPMHDSLGLEVLDREQCVALLAGAGVGRVVFTSQALPAIQPARTCNRDAISEYLDVVRVPGGSVTQFSE